MPIQASGQFLGIVALADTPREGVRQLLEQLHRFGIRKTIMLTGDNERVDRASRRIIRQSLWVSLGVVVTLIPATLFGWAGIGVTVLIHEGSTVIVVVNALRQLTYGNLHAPRPG